MKRVVVIGGGFAGSTAAKKLEKRFNVTLIDTKDYFEFTPGILRTIVDPKHLKGLHVKHKDYLKKARFVHGEVKKIDKKNVFVNGKKVKFDYLIISSGSYYSNPIKQKNVVMASRGDVLLKHHAELKKAKDVLIIGGGPVGVELAAEICTFFPDKKITIVHAREKVMERGHEKAVKYASSFITQKGIKTIYNERVSLEKRDHTFVTDKGTKIHADVAFLCTGIAPHFEFMKKNFKSSIDEHNRIIVNEFLQLKSHSNIFSAGDVNNVEVEKTAQNAQLQASVAAKNIIAMENKRDLEKYTSKKTPYILSLGKWCGILEYKNLVMTGIIPGIMKHIVEKKEIWQLKYL